MRQAKSEYYVDGHGLTQDGILYVRGVLEREDELILAEGL